MAILGAGGYGVYYYLQHKNTGGNTAQTDEKAIACPSTDLQGFMTKSPSPEQWVKAAKDCLAKGGTAPSPNYKIRFEVKNGEASAFNTHGDKVTAFPASDTEAWQKIIAKYRLLSAIEAQYNPAASPVRIALKQGNGLHTLKEHLDFSFDPNSDWRYFLLFDLAGTGELQFLYPLQDHGDPPALANIPYNLPLEVLPPTGEDSVVAVFCSTPQDRAVALLNSHNGKIPPLAESFLESLGKDCQIGSYAFFTGESSSGK